MKYLLDTDIIIYYLKDLHGISERINNYDLDDLAISIITYSELLYGAFNSVRSKTNIKIIEKLFSKIRVLSFCDKSAYIYAEQKAILKKSGKILADLDLMIASIAMHHDCTLITNNTKHFNRIKKLKLDNWCE